MLIELRKSLGLLDCNNNGQYILQYLYLKKNVALVFCSFIYLFFTISLCFSAFCKKDPSWFCSIYTHRKDY